IVTSINRTPFQTAAAESPCKVKVTGLNCFDPSSARHGCGCLGSFSRCFCESTNTSFVIDAIIGLPPVFCMLTIAVSLAVLGSKLTDIGPATNCGSSFSGHKYQQTTAVSKAAATTTTVRPSLGIRY